MRLRFIALVVAAVLVAGCPTEPVVTTVTLNSTTVSLDAIGATFQLSVSLADQNGKPIQAPVSWSSGDQAVATVDNNGLVTAVGNGATSVTATADGRSAAAQVTVAQVVFAVAKTGGDGQVDTVGQTLPVPLEIQVTDRLGVPVANAAVSFSVTAGNGSVGTPSTTTAATGRATTAWTLGTVAGAPQAVTATVSGKTAAFSATAVHGPADSLYISSGNNQTGATGTQLPNPLVVVVVDRYLNAVANHVVRWAVTTGGGSVSPESSVTTTVGQAQTNWTLGPTAGPQTAQATAVNVSKGSPAVFTATATAGTMAIFDGNNQTGLVGYAPNIRPSVIVRDGDNNPLAGVTVTFQVASGGGSVTGAIQTTNAQGVAQVGKWTLGATAGTNTLTATASGAIAGSPQTFTASGSAPGYTVELRVLNTITASQQAAFDSAKARWERLVYGELANLSVNISANACGVTHPAMNETIDDLVIFVRVESIDGAGGVLGSAGPCVIRSNSKLPAVGVMRFDDADLSNLEADGRLKDVILHEMGHVLGFGTLWGSGFFDFLRNPSCNGSTPIAGQDTYLEAARARAAFDTLGGTSYTGGAKVPVENSQGGCPGTRDGHWRESVFEHELMTGFIEAAGTANPLSIMSMGSFWDMAYTVNYDDADSYTRVFTAPPAAPSLGRLELLDDIHGGPIYVIDERGRTIRVIRR